MSSQAKALHADATMWQISHQPSPFPPPCKGVPDYDGQHTESSKEAGKLLQRYHFQQQASGYP